MLSLKEWSKQVVFEMSEQAAIETSRVKLAGIEGRIELTDTISVLKAIYDSNHGWVAP